MLAVGELHVCPREAVDEHLVAGLDALHLGADGGAGDGGAGALGGLGGGEEDAAAVVVSAEDRR